MSERNGSTNTNTSSICRRQAAFISRASKRIKSQRSYYPSYRLNSTHTPAPIEHHLPFLQLKKLCCLTPNGWEIHSRCRKGKLELQRPMDVTGVEQAYPDFLRNLLYDTTSASSAQFWEHIRSYNSTVSFAYLGAKIVYLPRRGPHVFKVHGHTYHRTSHLQPPNAQAPQLAQLYVLDSTHATEILQDHAAKEHCRKPILDQIDRFFLQHNRVAVSYHMMREIESQKTQCAVRARKQIQQVAHKFGYTLHHTTALLLSLLWVQKSTKKNPSKIKNNKLPYDAGNRSTSNAIR